MKSIFEAMVRSELGHLETSGESGEVPTVFLFADPPKQSFLEGHLKVEVLLLRIQLVFGPLPRHGMFTAVFLTASCVLAVGCTGLLSFFAVGMLVLLDT